MEVSRFGATVGGGLGLGFGFGFSLYSFRSDLFFTYHTSIYLVVFGGK